jgi:MFS family permease
VWTLAVYLVGTGLTALTPKGTGWILYLFATRVIAGMGIGGEYSAVDEMMPARYLGRTDAWINGSYWLGAIIGPFATFLILSSFRTSLGWRLAFLARPALAFVIIYVRRNLCAPRSTTPLSPHDRAARRPGRRAGRLRQATAAASGAGRGRGPRPGRRKARRARPARWNSRAWPGSSRRIRRRCRRRPPGC